MTKRFRPLDDGEYTLMAVPEVKRFFDVWRGEPELARMFIRNLARKLDEAERAAAQSCSAGARGI